MGPAHGQQTGDAGTWYLKKAIAILAVSDPVSLLQFIDQQRIYYPVPQLCQVLGIVLSHYYSWRQAQAVETTESIWETEMAAVFDHHKCRYGTRRRQVELWETGHRVDRQALRTGLRRHGKPCSSSPSFRVPSIQPTGCAAP